MMIHKNQPIFSENTLYTNPMGSIIRKSHWIIYETNNTIYISTKTSKKGNNSDVYHFQVKTILLVFPPVRMHLFYSFFYTFVVVITYEQLSVG